MLPLAVLRWKSVSRALGSPARSSPASSVRSPATEELELYTLSEVSEPGKC